ncbi:hypothetical protein NLG97_g10264 [Lecanicillium saksenae]|uniref:Uncharacterized protein n=1 Tax=Lecanicillium saksenae TaxID=468837 RepID=A0ACC1QGP5_9HYPO|nr:hypothetical protein NLG97_g10264 [Lecanicillium saksenae]
MVHQLLSSLGAALALGQIVVGVNMTFMDSCSKQDSESMYNLHKDAAYFNTTSATSFTVRDVTGKDNNWFVYLTVKDKAHENGTSSLDYWIGVPGEFLASNQANDTRICLATSKNYDKSLKHKNGNDTCKGVVSDDCLKRYPDEAAKVDYSQNTVPYLDAKFEDKCNLGYTTSASTACKSPKDTACGPSSEWATARPRT